MDENLLEQKIEELIEKKAEKIEQGEQPDSKLGELIEKKVEQKIDEEKETETVPQKTTRRNFMKMLGLGAGGLALSSAASANFFSVNKNVGSGGSQTLSDVLSEGNDVNNQNIVDGGTTIWNTNNQEIPASSIDETNLDANTLQGNTPKDLQGGFNYVQDSAPDNPSDAETWLDTSNNPYIEKIYNATSSEWNRTHPTETGVMAPSPTGWFQLFSTEPRYNTNDGQETNSGNSTVSNRLCDSLRVTTGSPNTVDYNVEFDTTVRVDFADGTSETLNFNSISDTSMDTNTLNFEVKEVTNVYWEATNLDTGSGTTYYDITVELHDAGHRHNL